MASKAQGRKGRAAKEGDGWAQPVASHARNIGKSGDSTESILDPNKFAVTIGDGGGERGCVLCGGDVYDIRF